MSLGKAQVDITGNLEPLRNALNRSRSAVASAMRHIGASIRRAFSSAVQKAVRATKWAFAGLAAAVVISTRAAMKQEEAEMRLSAALKSTGNEVESNMQRFKEFASQLQKVTVVGDETTLAAMQMGITMGVPIERIEEATKAAVGLSRAYQLDLNMAMRGVSLAMKGEYTLLNRYIPALREANTEAEKAAAYQNAIAQAFGFAQEEINSISGAWNQLKNAVGDVTEILGNPFAKALQRLAKYYQDNSASIDAWAKKVAENIDKAILKVQEYIGKLQNIFKEGGWEAIYRNFADVGEDLGRALGEAIKKSLKKSLSDMFSMENLKATAFNIAPNILNPQVFAPQQTSTMTADQRTQYQRDMTAKMKQAGRFGE